MPNYAAPFYKDIDCCRICGSTELTEVLRLEPQFLSPTFVETNEGNELSSIKVPMTMLVCGNNLCNLVQLRETTKPELLYTDYFYRSSTNDMMIEDLKKVVKRAQEQVDLKDDDIVVDIGANDCTMIQWYPKTLKRVAVEPAKNIDWSDVDESINIVNDFFPSPQFSAALGGKKVSIFTCCAMFYDLDDPNAFVSSVKEILDENGVWCIQLSYALSMIKNMNFYDICHEHLEYYTLKTLRYLMKRNGLHLYHAETNRVNGGSALVFITHDSRNKEDSQELLDLLNEEDSLGLYEPEAYEVFFQQMLDLSVKVRTHLENEIKLGNKVLGLGASTKGNVLLQFFGIDNEMLPAISERQKMKVGLKTLGSDIDLISEEDARGKNPTCMLVLPWYFKEEIVAREQDYLNSGGSLLFPMPYAHLVTGRGEVEL